MVAVVAKVVVVVVVVAVVALGVVEVEAEDLGMFVCDLLITSLVVGTTLADDTVLVVADLVGSFVVIDVRFTVV